MTTAERLEQAIRAAEVARRDVLVTREAYRLARLRDEQARVDLCRARNAALDEADADAEKAS